MGMTIIDIVLVVLLLGILWHICCLLMVIFHQGTTDIYVKKILEDPYKYVRYERMCSFMRNMFYLYLVCVLLSSACNGNKRYYKNTKQIETSDVKDK